MRLSRKKGAVVELFANVREYSTTAPFTCALQERIETVGEDSDLREVYETERHLLYVACTRARDHLLVTSVEPASEFLDDLRQKR